MEFPAFYNEDNDMNVPWDALNLNVDNSSFQESVFSQNIDNSSAGTQPVIEDVCFSVPLLSEEDTTSQDDKILFELPVKKYERSDPIMAAHDPESDWEQAICTDQHGVRDIRLSRRKRNHSSSSLPLSQNSIGCSKKTPTILVVSDSSVSSSGKRGPPGGDPNSKNAIAARDNRLKKKKYIADLEHSVMQLRSENLKLRKESSMKRKSLACLQQEVRYLKGVIANQSTLSAILRSVSQTPGIKLGSSFGQPATDLLDKNLSNSENLSEVSSSNENDTKPEECLGFQRGKSKFSCHQTSKICTRQSTANLKTFEHNKKSSPLQTNQKASFAKKFKVTSKEIPINVEDSETDSETDVDSDDECIENDTSKEQSICTEDDLPSGICFHVSGNKVSLELCSHCNSSALLDHTYVK